MASRGSPVKSDNVPSIKLGSKDLASFKGPTYNVQDDVEKLTKYFDQRWGSLEKAQNALGWDTLEQEYDILQFEHLLRSWGVKVDSVTDLFDQIDMDYSGRVSVQELFNEIARPLEELQEREKQRKDNERERMYDAFAEGIQRTYGSIEDAFKALAHSTEQELSVAQFMNLANKLQVDLSVAQLHRAFNEIDKDGGAKISLSELKEALESHLVKKSLVAVAIFLVENHGSIGKPLEDFLGDAGATAGQEMSARSSVASPLGGLEKRDLSNFSPLESGAMRDRSGSLEDMQEAEKQEQRILRALRKLQVVPHAIREEACKALLKSLRKQGHLTVDKFTECLQAEHEKHTIEEKRKKMDADHRERLSQKALKRALRTDNKRAVQEEVAEWATRAQKGGPGVHRPEDVTRSCVQEARAAMARTQLKDYVDELRNHLESRQGELFKLQSEVEEEARLVGEFFPMGPLQTPPTSVARRRGLGGMFAVPGFVDPGDTSFENRPHTPDTPATPYTTGSRTPMTKSRAPTTSSLRPESKAKRAEQLVQAAASSDMAALQRLLAGDADPNAVGWSGATPLMAAAHHGREAAIDLLVLKGADVLRTDVRGRTALDHAYRRPSARDRLRAYGALTGSDLERRAQDLARRVLQVEQERAKLEAQLSQLPSKEVRERQIQQHRSASGVLSPPTLNSPRRRTRSNTSMQNVSVDEGNEGDAAAAPQAPLEMMRASSAPTPSIEIGLPVSALARRSPHDSVKKDKHTRIVLPVKQRGEA